MYLGIDLGTSNSAIAVYEDGNPTILKTIEKGTDVLPSVIYIDKRGKQFCGHRAYEHIPTNPKDVAHGFKRQMGTSWKHEFIKAGKEMNAEECSATILQELVKQARVEKGESNIEGVVITTPAAFNQMQIEATYKAANIAGLEKVALLQEPVAAAMAAVAKFKNKDGMFLVYDIGGGTFDLALVQSTGGKISIIAHEGINALGGRDFDRIIVNSIIRPWLLENFAIPADFQKHEKYNELTGKLSMIAEEAKIALSGEQEKIIYSSEEMLKIEDDEGKEIYIEIGISQERYKSLIADKVDEMILLSREILKKNGYESRDLDRLIFIGGPSKTPYLREVVAHELALPVDLKADPMTTVAMGAAIFCESVDWDSADQQRKKMTASSETVGAAKIQYDYEKRTAKDCATLRITPQDEATQNNFEVQVDSDQGWTSGKNSLAKKVMLSLPLEYNGENHFRVMVFDKKGVVMPEAEHKIVITKLAASADSLRLTHNLSAVVRGDNEDEGNVLHIFAEKGIALPKSGKADTFRVARDLTEPDDSISVQLFEQPEEENKIPGEPNLFIGLFDISRKDIGADILKGDDICIHWRVNESGLMKFSIELPKTGDTFDFETYSNEMGHRSYEGAAGEKYVADTLKDAEGELQKTKDVATSSDGHNIRKIKNSLDEQKHELESASDGEERRAIAEKIRDIRQKIAAIRNNPQNRCANLKKDLDELEKEFGDNCRDNAGEDVCDRFDELSAHAQKDLEQGDSGFKDAQRRYEEMMTIYMREIHSNPSFIVGMFKHLAGQEHLAVNADKHSDLVDEGRTMLASNDIDGLRTVIGRLLENHIQTSVPITDDISKISDIMRK